MRRLLTAAALMARAATSVLAQEPATPTREAAIVQVQAEKVKTLHPQVPGKVEALLNRADAILAGGVPSWHPFLDSAYSGGGFTLGIGYAHHVSPYNLFDVRGSYTVRDYKRVEAEFTAPRLFHRRGALTVLGGWREATRAGFYAQPISETQSPTTTLEAPPGLPATSGSFVGVDLSIDSAAHPTWRRPVRTYFRRGGEGWTLVGLERMSEE